MSDVLRELDRVIAERFTAADPQTSYVARLHAEGLDRILKKVGEEASETIIAAKNHARGSPDDALARETADLWFHSLVMLAECGLDSSSVLDELRRRFGLSGIDEKASRGSTATPSSTQ